MPRQLQKRRLFVEQLEERTLMTVDSWSMNDAPHVALTIADLDNDGAAEFIYSDRSLNQISIARSLSTQGMLVDDYGRLSAPAAVAVADLNGDDWADLIVPNTAANELLVFLANAKSSQPNAAPFLPPMSLASGLSPSSVSVADLNADGTLDLVVANRDSNDLSVLLGAGSNAGWALKPGPRLETAAAPTATTIVDVTGPNNAPDGILDIVVTNSESNTAGVMRGLGDGNFVPPNAPPVGGSKPPNQGIDPADLDVLSLSATLAGSSGRANTVVDFVSLRGSHLPTVATLVTVSRSGIPQGGEFGKSNSAAARRCWRPRNVDAGRQSEAALDTPAMDTVSRMLIDLDEQVQQVHQDDSLPSARTRAVSSARGAGERTTSRLTSPKEQPPDGSQSRANAPR